MKDNEDDFVVNDVLKYGVDKDTAMKVKLMGIDHFFYFSIEGYFETRLKILEHFDNTNVSKVFLKTIKPRVSF